MFGSYGVMEYTNICMQYKIIKQLKNILIFSKGFLLVRVTVPTRYSAKKRLHLKD